MCWGRGCSDTERRPPHPDQRWQLGDEPLLAGSHAVPQDQRPGQHAQQDEVRAHKVERKVGRWDRKRLGDDGVIGLQVDQAQGQDRSGRCDVQIRNVALNDELQGWRAMLKERVSLSVLLTS